MSQAKREKMGAALMAARKDRGHSVEFVAIMTDMSQAQVRRNENGEFGVVQDIVIVKHLIALGLTARGVLK